MKKNITDYKRTKDELIAEIRSLRQKVAALEGAADAAPAQKRDPDSTYRELVDLLPQTVFEIKAGGQITYVNRFGLEFYGFTREDLQRGYTALDLVIESDRPHLLENIQRRIKGDTATGNEYTTLKKDGTPVSVIIYSAPIIKEEGITGFRGVIIDISQRKAAENAASEYAQKIRAIFDTVSDSLTILDLEGRIVDVNEAAVRHARLTTKDQIIGTSGFSYINPAQAEHTAKQFASLLKTGGSRMERIKIISPEGNDTDTEINASLFRDTRGTPVGVVAISRDITTRVISEKQLKESEKRFHGIFATAPVAIFLWDQECRITEWNPRAEELFGWSRGEALGKSFIDLIIPPDERDRIVLAASSILDRRFPAQGVSTALRRDGSRITVEWNSSIIDDRVNAITGVLTMGLDITERKRAEDARSRLTDILEQTSDLVGTSYPDGRIIYLNRAGRQMAGWPQDESLEGHTINDLHPAWAYTLIRDTGLPETARSGIWQGETAVLHIDGTETPVSQVIIAHRTRDEIEYFSTIMRDITELKLGEYALRESEERFRRMAENIQDGLTIVERGRVVYVNHRACEIFGIRRDEILRFTGIEAAAPEEHERLRAILTESVKTGVSPDELEFWIHRPDGSRRCVHNRYSLSHKGEEVIGRYIITTDVTERRIAEDARLTLERQILHSQKLESLGVLAGGIAHDFNNLLMAIQGNIDLAVQALPPGERGRDFLHEAEVASRRAAELTRQMLAYSGKGKFVVEHLNLSEHVDELAHLLRTTVPRTIGLETTLDHDVPLIEADPAQIQQVVMNLITNAAEAIGSNPGLIRVVTGSRHTDTGELTHSRLDDKPPAGRYVFIEVSDTGCGMDEDTQRRLFEPFFSTKFTGRGLGMSAVLGIVRSHRGAILLNSLPGKGSNFSVFFPVSEHSAGKSARESNDSRTAGGDILAGTVLLVDDEELVRDVARRMLEHLGFTVITAENGTDALAAYAAAPGEIDCVILDLTMPGMDGVATFRELKAIRDGVSVIISSGYSEQEVSSRFGVHEMAGFIQKPYQLKQLSEALRRVINR